MRTRRLIAVLALAAGLVLFGAASPAWAVDTDGDGVDDAIDVCNDTPPDTAVDGEGRPLGDIDLDCDTDLTDYALFASGMTGPLSQTDPNGPVEFVTIPGGTFMMGDSFGEENAHELPVHSVTLSSFKMSAYEVTNRHYVDFLNAADDAGQIVVTGGVVYPSGGGNAWCDTTASSVFSQITYSDGVFQVIAGRGNHPMVMVVWFGAEAFCDWYGYRLPTEAEWEYAARGGQHSPYYRFPWGDHADGDQQTRQRQPGEELPEPLALGAGQVGLVQGCLAAGRGQCRVVTLPALHTCCAFPGVLGRNPRRQLERSDPLPRTAPPVESRAAGG